MLTASLKFYDRAAGSCTDSLSETLEKCFQARCRLGCAFTLVAVRFAGSILFVAAAVLFYSAAVSAGSVDPSGFHELLTESLSEAAGTSTPETTGPERFDVVLDGAAVRDRETGVLWEQSPEPTTMSWDEAVEHCSSLELAGRKQWRLPTIDELASLVDASVLGSPKLPRAHPFDTNCKLGGCVQSSFYWSETPCEDKADHAWLACFCNGSVTRSDKSYDNHVWCAQVEKGHGRD